MGKRHERLWAGVILLFLLPLLAAGCAGGTAVTTTAATTVPTIYVVGDSAQIAGYEVTLDRVYWADESCNELLDSEECTMLMDCTVVNRTGATATVSGALMFVLMDETPNTSDLQLDEDLECGLDGEVAPDQQIQGQMAFTVLRKHNQWTLMFQPDGQESSDQAMFEIQRDDVR